MVVIVILMDLVTAPPMMKSTLLVPEMPDVENAQLPIFRVPKIPLIWSMAPSLAELTDLRAVSYPEIISQLTQILSNF